jgi:hypothetical protein
LNQISLNQRAAEVANRNSAAVTASRYTVVRDGIADDLWSGRRSVAARDQDATSALAAVARPRLVVGSNRVALN